MYILFKFLREAILSLDVCVCFIVVSQSGAHCHDKIPFTWALVKQKCHMHLDTFPINIFWVGFIHFRNNA